MSPKPRKITVATPGTAVQLESSYLPGSKVTIVPIPTNTGRVYLGTSGVVGSTATNVIRWFNPPSATGLVDMFEIDVDQGGNLIDDSVFWVDAAVAGEGVLITEWQE